VTVISPEVTPALGSLAARGQVLHHPRAYRPGDLHGCFLAFAATDDPAAQAQVTAEAAREGVLLNVVDQPQRCDFIMPAVMQRGDLVIAASTSGASPALARRIRHELENAFGPEYEFALQLLRRLRDHLTRQSYPSGERQRIFSALVESRLLDCIRAHQATEVDRLLAATVGHGVSLAALGMELS
jgi:precorrin-2 dehydrogenase/sirohydrochlorin ferrochelatase